MTGFLTGSLLYVRGCQTVLTADFAGVISSSTIFVVTSKTGKAAVSGVVETAIGGTEAVGFLDLVDAGVSGLFRQFEGTEELRPRFSLDSVTCCVDGGVVDVA